MSDLHHAQTADLGLTRRLMLKQLAAGSVALGVAGPSLLLTGCASTASQATANSAANAATDEPSGAVPALNGRVRHSVASWTYAHLSIEELCQLVKSLGFSAIDLVGPKDWPTLKKYGIDCSMCNGAEINLVDGWCNPQFHAELIKRYRAHIDWSPTLVTPI